MPGSICCQTGVQGICSSAKRKQANSDGAEFSTPDPRDLIIACRRIRLGHSNLASNGLPFHIFPHCQVCLCEGKSLGDIGGDSDIVRAG
jgi:hypothetical protein